MSCGWRKLLQLRVDILLFIWRRIGNGESIHFWSDTWCDYSPLRQHITPREIYRAGSFIDMDQIGGKWEDIIRWVTPRIRVNSARSIIERLVISALAYYIWQERNARIFKNELRSPKQLSEVVLSMVRMRIFSIQFKDTRSISWLMERWKIEKIWMRNGAAVQV
ncbi:hypothetical protein QVD17_41647 [Tagetes erecta]|uniref:Reverse transcriptase zinc-binding domain-containing protein n=1 Tax=Tagetes erecta TaxID=13708 RepID=A0AAD8NFT1_TARER|nr:hypothetical protein QVD17_41647 [Tagetes erecta]